MIKNKVFFTERASKFLEPDLIWLYIHNGGFTLHQKFEVCTKRHFSLDIEVENITLDVM